MEFDSPSHKHPNWRSGLPKLSDQDVAEIRRRWNERPTTKSMAAEYGVTYSYIQKIIQGRCRKPQV